MKQHKQVHLICQAKGGVGKSFLTYLIYQKTREEEGLLFIDLDNANQTTLKRLPEGKVKGFEVLDAKKKINREAFLGLFETISHTEKSNTFYIDMGATESIEFLHMMTENFEPKDLKAEFETMSLEVSFNIIVSGGDVYLACVKFLNELITVIKTHFKIIIWVNMGKFNAINDSNYLDSIRAYDGMTENIAIKRFGSTDTEESDANLIEMIKNGTEIHPEKLPLATRIKYRKLTNEIEL